MKIIKSPPLLVTLIDGLADASFFMVLAILLSRTAEPWWLTALAVTGFFTGILCAPVVGWVADRFPGHICWPLSLAFSALTVIIIGLFPAPAVIIIASMLNGASGGITNAAEFKLLPQSPGMTPSTASAYIVGITSLCSVIAPPLAAFFATYNIQATIIGSGVLLGFSALLAWRYAPVSKPGELSEAVRRDGFKEIFIGFSALNSSKALAPFLPVIALVVASTSMEGVSGVFYLQSITRTPFEYSLLLSMWAVGTFIASIFYGRNWYRPHVVSAILWGGLLIGCAILVEGLVPNPWIVGGAFLIGGFFNSIHNMGIRDMIYTQVPEHRQGQSWALIGSLFGSMVLIGDILGTPGLLGTPQQVVLYSGIIGTGAAALNIIIYLILRRRILRHIREAGGEAEPAASP